MTFTDRNIDGEVGTYTVLYSDFRDEGGLLLPHQVRALFNGQPDPFQSWAVQSIQVNPAVDAALFTRPSTESR